MTVRELTYGDAVKEAIAEEMRRDPRVFLIGEDVAEAGHPFKTLVGLVQEFGTDRVIDTPISEPGYAGIGVGAAMTGMRPVVDVMFGDFITLTMDQMVNQAAQLAHPHVERDAGTERWLLEEHGDRFAVEKRRRSVALEGERGLNYELELVRV